MRPRSVSPLFPYSNVPENAKASFVSLASPSQTKFRSIGRQITTPSPTKRSSLARKPSSRRALARPTTAKGVANAGFVNCDLCKSTFLASSFMWHRQKCEHTHARRQERRWLGTTITSFERTFPRDTRIITWQAGDEHVNRYSPGPNKEFIRNQPEKQKCDCCGSYVSAFGFDFHAKKCAIRQKKRRTAFNEQQAYTTGNFHGSNMDACAGWKTTEIMTRTWWHASSPSRGALSKSVAIKTRQCGVCKSPVLQRSFDQHVKKCKAKLTPDKLSKILKTINLDLPGQNAAGKEDSPSK